MHSAGGRPSGGRTGRRTRAIPWWKAHASRSASAHPKGTRRPTGSERRRRRLRASASWGAPQLREQYRHMIRTPDKLPVPGACPAETRDRSASPGVADPSPTIGQTARQRRDRPMQLPAWAVTSHRSPVIGQPSSVSPGLARKPAEARDRSRLVGRGGQAGVGGLAQAHLGLARRASRSGSASVAVALPCTTFPASRGATDTAPATRCSPPATGPPGGRPRPAAPSRTRRLSRASPSGRAPPATSGSGPPARRPAPRVDLDRRTQHRIPAV